MKKTRAIILGGGISGLSLAYFLSKNPSYEVLLLEKEARLGGMLQTDRGEFFFERGPRTFKTSRSSALLDLCKELKIQDQIISAEKSAHHRYLWCEGKLQLLPNNLKGFLTSKLTRSFALALLKEWMIPCYEGDETIWDFVCRRFNQSSAELLFDPLTTGIYAGDIQELSVESCFTTLKEWERSYGSLTKGFFKAKRKKNTSGIKASLFSFKEGTEALVSELKRQTRADIVLNKEVDALDFSKSGVEVFSGKECWQADIVFCALPSYAAARLFRSSIAEDLKNIRYAPLTVVNLGYREDVLALNAFGYLIPRKEKEDILGAVFDSKVFTEQNREGQTRLTAMIGACVSKEEGVERAIRAVKKHLCLESSPGFVKVSSWEKAIPQFTVGHKNRMALLQDKMKKEFPHCVLLGNYLSGVSVNDCIEEAKRVAKECSC